MRKSFALPLLFILFLSACTTGTAVEPVPTQPEENQSTPAIAITVNSITPTLEITPLPVPIMTATPEPTPTPVLFDRIGYRDFAIVRDHFPEMIDYVGDESFSEISTSFNPLGNQIVLSACRGSMTNTWMCQRSSSGFLVVLDGKTGGIAVDIPLGDAWPARAVFLNDGKNLLYSTNEYRVALWDITTGEPGLVFLDQTSQRENDYPDVAAAPDGKSVAAVVLDTLYVWDMTGELLFQAPADKGRIDAGLAYSADGLRLAVYAPDNAGVDIYETTGWTLVNRVVTSDIRISAVSPDGKYLVTIPYYINTATVWDIDSGEKIVDLNLEVLVYGAQFNPQGDLLVVTGIGNLDNPDGYTTIGTIYETQSWTKLDNLYSYLLEGRVKFSQDGSQMAVMGNSSYSIWEAPDETLNAGFEVVKQFQEALSTGDYEQAASLFSSTESELDYLKEYGLNPDDLAGSFEQLCSTEAIFCHPVKESVIMGYDWDYLSYLVRLSSPDGKTFTSPKGAQIITLYVLPDVDGTPKIVYLPMD